MPSPNRDPAKMTKMAEIRMPIRPSYWFPEEQRPRPPSSDMDSCAENERERRLRGAKGGEGVSEMGLDGYR